MVLLDPIVQILVRPVFYPFVQLSPDRAGVTVVTIRCHPRGNDAGHHFNRSKERLHRRHVARLAQADIDQSAGAIDRAMKVAPVALELDIGFVDVPASPDPTLTPPSQTVDQGWASFASQSRTVS